MKSPSAQNRFLRAIRSLSVRRSVAARAMISLSVFRQHWRWRPAEIGWANRQVSDPPQERNPPADPPRLQAAMLDTRRGHRRARVSRTRCAVEAEARAPNPNPRPLGVATPASPQAASEFQRDARRAASSSPRKGWPRDPCHARGVSTRAFRSIAPLRRWTTALRRNPRRESERFPKERSSH